MHLLRRRQLRHCFAGDPVDGDGLVADFIFGKGPYLEIEGKPFLIVDVDASRQLDDAVAFRVGARGFGIQPEGDAIANGSCSLLLLRALARTARI